MNDELQLKQIFVKNIDEKIDGVVKASDEDIAWLYGEDTPVEKVMRR